MVMGTGIYITFVGVIGVYCVSVPSRLARESYQLLGKGRKVLLDIAGKTTCKREPPQRLFCDEKSEDRGRIRLYVSLGEVYISSGVRDMAKLARCI
jgi:hypothetical protein